jgi:hypothetical protein
MAIFNSYVKLPEGNSLHLLVMFLFSIYSKNNKKGYSITHPVGRGRHEKPNFASFGSFATEPPLSEP